MKVGGPPPAGDRAATLKSQVAQVLGDYFAVLEGERPCDLYEVVMREVELPLLLSVMDYAEHNQSRAAQMLGLSRGTLRKKLKDHGLL